ncbi:TPA: hypothetical protein AB5D21_003253 [Vibrio cholerae]
MFISFVETKSCLGHINYYNKFIADLSLNNTVEVVSSEKICRSLSVNDGVKLSSVFKANKKNKIAYNIQQVLLCYKALIYAINNKSEKVIFAAYDTFAIGFLCLIFPALFSKIKVEVFEHNNIDQLSKSRVKKWLYKLSSTKVSSIVFESYIGQFIKDNYERDYWVYEHPLVNFKGEFKNKLNIDSKYVFLPSAAVEEFRFRCIAEYCIDNDLLLVCKLNAWVDDYKNVIVREYFDDYESLLLNCEFLAIANDFSYRVSGVFYEGIANGCNFLVCDNLMFNKLIGKYKNINIIMLNPR